MTDKNREIGKLADFIKQPLDNMGKGKHTFTKEQFSEEMATFLYEQGYRKQREGEWEQVGDDHFDLCFRCSNCREEFSCEVEMSIFAKFCPNCGAHMKGGAEE